MTDFSVTDMTCGHCVSAITRAIKAIDASALVSFDLDKRVVGVESASPASEILSTIRAAGYTAVIGSDERAVNAPSCCGSHARNTMPHS